MDDNYLNQDKKTDKKNSNTEVDTQKNNVNSNFLYINQNKSINSKNMDLPKHFEDKELSKSIDIISSENIISEEILEETKQSGNICDIINSKNSDIMFTDMLDKEIPQYLNVCPMSTNNTENDILNDVTFDKYTSLKLNSKVLNRKTIENKSYHLNDYTHTLLEMKNNTSVATKKQELIYINEKWNQIYDSNKNNMLNNNMHSEFYKNCKTSILKITKPNSEKIDNSKQNMKYEINSLVINICNNIYNTRIYT